MIEASAAWYIVDCPPGELARPGIYEWHIEGVGSYVGKSRNLHRRLREYPNNVRKLADGLPYRRSKPAGYRRIHRELLKAKEARIPVVVRLLESCSAEALSARERFWISEKGTLND